MQFVYSEVDFQQLVDQISIPQRFVSSSDDRPLIELLKKLVPFLLQVNKCSFLLVSSTPMRHSAAFSSVCPGLSAPL